MTSNGYVQVRAFELLTAKLDKRIGKRISKAIESSVKAKKVEFRWQFQRFIVQTFIQLVAHATVPTVQPLISPHPVRSASPMIHVP